jgi:uncharacterized protein (TIGR02391 family)
MEVESIEWAQSKLDDLEVVVEKLRLARGAKDSAETRAVVQELELKMVPVTAIAEFLFDEWNWNWSRSYDYLMQRIQQIRGKLIYAAEIEEYLQPAAPGLRADRLHPWVWQGAQSLWASGHYADAVETVAKKVNAELQNKIGRRDLSDAKLCSESFSVSNPSAKAPRLRFEGDRTSETWRARQGGAASLSSGAFTAIRNPLAHEGDTDLGEHQALELLAVFSVIARWVDDCSVDTAPTAEEDTVGLDVAATVGK